MVKHTRTLQLEEEVLCVKFSPDHRLLAVSLLDCTVKVFYTDTLKVHLTYSLELQDINVCLIHSLSIQFSFLTKPPSLFRFQFFLSLYGHKLPVLCLDIAHVSNSKVTEISILNLKSYMFLFIELLRWFG